MLRQLHVQVLIGLVLAVVPGVLAPGSAVAMRPPGDGVIAPLRMLLGPVIFCSVVPGLAHVRDMGQLGRLAATTLLCFEMMSMPGLALRFAW